MLRCGEELTNTIAIVLTTNTPPLLGCGEELTKTFLSDHPSNLPLKSYLKSLPPVPDRYKRFDRYSQVPERLSALKRELRVLNQSLPSTAFIPLCTVNDRASCVLRIAEEVENNRAKRALFTPK